MRSIITCTSRDRISNPWFRSCVGITSTSMPRYLTVLSSLVCPKELLRLQKGRRNPVCDRVSRLFGDCKLHRPLRLLLHDNRAGCNMTTLHQIMDAQPNQITTARVSLSRVDATGKVGGRASSRVTGVPARHRHRRKSAVLSSRRCADRIRRRVQAAPSGPRPESNFRYRAHIATAGCGLFC